VTFTLVNQFFPLLVLEYVLYIFQYKGKVKKPNVMIQYNQYRKNTHAVKVGINNASQ